MHLKGVILLKIQALKHSKAESVSEWITVSPVGSAALLNREIGLSDKTFQLGPDNPKKQCFS